MNSDVIRLLPDAVANQIAAGEVIQRPASVIKELVENSIDAGATSVQIIIKDAGRTLIQVVDNGKGMSVTDARLAFERHATSKITNADDLYSLHTMGFRGEALPSIAAVAQIDMRTMQQGGEVGTRIRISESKFEDQEPCGCPPGTNLMVKNLFFHMPARRRFLKKDSVEFTHILREFERLALVNSDVEFTIIHNDVTLHQLLPGTLKQRISALFGKPVGSKIIPIATETSIVKINGFIGVPAAAKKRSAPQFFFVNGRNMRHPYFHKAVLSCYSELISPESQPPYFINFEVDPATIDVNIHPQKHEIKFENEQPIWQILTAAVKQALGRINAAGAIDFDSDDPAPDIPVFMPDTTVPAPGLEIDPHYNPFDITLDNSEPSNSPKQTSTQPTERRSVIGSNYRPAKSVMQDWDKLYESFETRRNASIKPADSFTAKPLVDNTETVPTPEHPMLPETDSENYTDSGFLNIHNKYIAVPSRDGIMLVHRYRAHLRILFDEYMSRLNTADLPSQRLIFPETITLSASHSSILSAMGPVSGRLGYEVSFLGDNTWAINGTPTLPGNQNAIEVLQRMIADLYDTGEEPSEAVITPAALSLARSAAFRPNRQLSTEETDALLARLFSCSDPSFTPDGLPIIYHLRENDIQKMFN